MDPNQIIQWIVIGIAMALFALDKARKAIKDRNNPFAERIAKLETGLKDLKERVERIERKLNKMK